MVAATPVSGAAGRDGLAARFLSLPGSDEPGAATLKSDALRILVPFTLACELLFEANYELGFPVALFALIVLSGHFRRIASAMLLVLVLYAILVAFPNLANHFYLQALLLTLCVMLDPDDEADQQLLVQGARWIVVAVLFWSGAKKLMYGTYFQGEYLARMIATDARFAEFFGLFIAEEVARFQSYAGEAGTGPYRVAGVAGFFFAALSNAVWIGEMTVPLLLVWRRARRFAWVLGLLLLLGIEIVAREVFFGLLFSSVLLSFAAPPYLWRAMPWIMGFQLLLIALRLAGAAPPLMS